MKTVYVIGAVVGAIAVGAAAYGGYRMLRATKDAEQRALTGGMTGGVQNTEQPISQQRPGVSGLSLVNRDFTVPVIRGRLSVPVTAEPVAQNAETVDPEPSRRPRTNLLLLR